MWENGARNHGAPGKRRQKGSGQVLRRTHVLELFQAGSWLSTSSLLPRSQRPVSLGPYIQTTHRLHKNR